MKYMLLIINLLVFASCTKFLIGEKKLSFNKSTPHIIISMSKKYKNDRFYIIPIEKVQECRYYPHLYYLGSEDRYSYFTCCGKVKYRDEITEFALPDSICVNKYPNTIDDEIKTYKGNRRAIIVDNKMVVADN